MRITKLKKVFSGKSIEIYSFATNPIFSVADARCLNNHNAHNATGVKSFPSWSLAVDEGAGSRAGRKPQQWESGDNATHFCGKRLGLPKVTTW